MSARILIAGAPTGCWTNAGDEAVLAAMARDLRAALPGAQLTVVSSNPPGTLHPLGIAEVGYGDIAGVIAAARASDLMVLGGGSIFFDYWGFDASTVLTSRHEGLAFYGGFGLLARLLGRPLMIYAVGVGPLRSPQAREFTRAVFDAAAAVTLRDADSRAVLDELGARPARVEVTADPAFGLDVSAADGRRVLMEAAGGTPRAPVLGIAVREWEQPGAAWEETVATALARFQDQHGGTVVFVPLHRTVDWPLTGDRAVAERLRARLRGPALVLSEDLPWEAKAGVLQHCDLVLAMRMHAAVFAAAGGVPVVGLSYDAKVAAVFDALGQADFVAPLQGASAIGPLLERAWADRDRLGPALRARAAALGRAARENAAIAAETLLRPAPHRADPILADALLGLAGKLDRSEQHAPAGGAVTTAAEPAASAAHVAAVEAELARIRGSRGWRLLERLWRVREAIAPHGSRRERLLGLAPAAAPPLVVPASEPSIQTDQAEPPPRIGFASALAAARAGASEVTARPAPAPEGHRRVALLTNRLLDWTTREPRFGGAERYALTLGRLLRSHGFDVCFYQASTSEAFEGDYYEFPVVALPRSGHLAEFEFGVGEAFHEATRGDAHVVYVMPNYASGPMREDALVVCHGIWFDHDLLPPPFTFRTPEWFAHLYRVFSRPRQVVSVDTNSINVLRSFWPEVAARMTYIPNGVDTGVFTPPASYNAVPPVVLFPRRSDVIRGSRILGDILDGIPHRWRMRWVGDGDGEEPERIRAVARRDPRLSMTSATFEEMPAVYREAEICVIPTIASEGTSLACLEALASGCAVVATHVGGLADLVHPGLNGMLVDPEPAAIAQAVNFLIENPDERRRLQRAARESAAAFRLELWEQRWTALIERLGWRVQRAAELSARAR